MVAGVESGYVITRFACSNGTTISSGVDSFWVEPAESLNRTPPSGNAMRVVIIAIAGRVTRIFAISHRAATRTTTSTSEIVGNDTAGESITVARGARNRRRRR